MVGSLDSKVQWYSLPINKKYEKADKYYQELKEDAKRLNIFTQFIDTRCDAVRAYKKANKINGDWLSYMIALTEYVNKECETFLGPYLEREEKEKSYECEKEFKKRQIKLNLEGISLCWPSR